MVGYSEAAVEVLDILNNTNKYDLKKIPESFINFLTDIASKTYKVNFDHTKPINELDVKKETKDILGFIYITWWCGEDKQKEYKKIIQEKRVKKEEILKEKYSSEIIFKNNKNEEINIENRDKTIEQTGMVEYKKENFIKKVLNKILYVLGIK